MNERRDTSESRLSKIFRGTMWGVGTLAIIYGIGDGIEMASREEASQAFRDFIYVNSFSVGAAWTAATGLFYRSLRYED